MINKVYYCIKIIKTILNYFYKKKLKVTQRIQEASKAQTISVKKARNG
jgi:hypothetical protein